MRTGLRVKEGNWDGRWCCREAEDYRAIEEKGDKGNCGGKSMGCERTRGI